MTDRKSDYQTHLLDDSLFASFFFSLICLPWIGRLTDTCLLDQSNDWMTKEEKGGATKWK